MSLPTSGSSDQSVGALLQELAHGTSRLVQQEWRLARLELEELARQIGIGTVQIGVAGVCFALGGASLLACAALAIGEPWMRDHLAIVLAAGVVLLAVVAVLLVTVGLKKLVPEEHAGRISTEDDAWRNRRRMSAATSK